MPKGARNHTTNNAERKATPRMLRTTKDELDEMGVEFKDTMKLIRLEVTQIRKQLDALTFSDRLAAIAARVARLEAIHANDTE